MAADCVSNIRNFYPLLKQLFKTTNSYAFIERFNSYFVDYLTGEKHFSSKL